MTDMNANTDTWPRPHRLTVDEYYRMAEVGLLAHDARVELIEGEIIDMAPIGSRHAAMVDRLAQLLILASGLAAQVRTQHPLRLDEHSEPQPDIALVRRRGDGYSQSHPTATDALLVIEVSDSTLRYDQETKAALYAAHGIPNFWIVDLPGRQLHCFAAPTSMRYRERTTTAAPGSMSLPGLPGIAVDLTGLFDF